MKLRNFYIIIGVLLLLLLGYLWQQRRQISVGNVWFSDVNFDKIDQIQIKKGDNLVNLEVTDGQWQVNDYEADQDKMQRVWSFLEDFSVSGPVSVNPNNHEKFEIGEDKGVEVKLNSGNDVKVDFIFGKTAEKFGSTYVRRSDSDDVYVVNAALATIFSTEDNDWRNKTIADLDAGDIQKMTVDYSDAKYIFSKDDNDWKITGAGDFDESKIPDLLQIFRPLKASGFADAVAAKTADTEIDIEIGLDEGRVYKFKFSKHDDEWQVVYNQKPDTVYQVAGYKLDPIVNRIFLHQTD